MIEYHLWKIEKHGWLCRVTRDDREIYRGEFQPWAELALEYAIANMEKDDE